MTHALVALGYGGVLAVTFGFSWVMRKLRLPPGLMIVVLGLAIGRTGFRLIDPAWIPPLVSIISLHIAFVLGALGVQLGRGLLRLSAWEVVRRSLPPLLLAAAAWLIATRLLPLLPADLAPGRSFRRFVLPLSFVLAAFPLLAIRDLRGRAPHDVGPVFLAALALVGAAISFAPPFLWSSHIELGYVWRGPALLLGESGSFGVFSAVLFLFLTRVLRLPRVPTAVVLLLAVAWICHEAFLWLPFTGLGFGMALGRAGEPAMPLPFADRNAPYSEHPFALLAALSFAPHLWWTTLAWPTLLHAALLCVLVVVVRWRVTGGSRLVTGPGFLFLGLALVVRLDGRTGPIALATIDFALPAWVAVRGAVAVVHKLTGARPEDTTDPSPGLTPAR
jgi:hypothetical protein